MRILLVWLVVIALSMSTAEAMFGRPDLEKIPVGKLVENLTKLANESPGDAKLWQNLARAHAMAYSKKLTDDADVALLKPKGELWFGYLPAFIPYAKTEKTDDLEVKEVADAHLKASIDAYQKAIKLNPKEATIWLGLGWCLQQDGKEKDAADHYRKALEKFWESDKKRTGRFGAVGTLETAKYLTALLDEQEDAEEIAQIKEKVLHIEALPRAITPVAVALSPGTSLDQLLAPEAAVTFDADGTGRKLSWSWITPKAGWLVYDEVGEGKIDSAIQLFGSRSFMMFLDHGYEAMNLLDENRDSMLQGAELSKLSLWIDKDSDGVSDPGEVQSLARHGIVGLNIESKVHPSGIRFSPGGAMFSSGEVTPTYDVMLQQQK